MKTKLLAITIFINTMIFAQENTNFNTENRSAVFTVNPSKNTTNTTGINVGIVDDYNRQKINGFNFQLNPIVILYPLLPQAIEVPTEENATVIVNGLHISTGGFTDARKLNGIGISAYHHSMVTNGFTVNFYNNTSGKLNGLHISGFVNTSKSGSGVTISVIGNDSEKFYGIQAGGFNESTALKGLQIGVVNKSKNLRGLQIGLWNVNEKRKLPLINWNFKK